MSTFNALSPRIGGIRPREHEDFLPLLPVVAKHASVVFRHLPDVHREEAIAEAIASAFESFVSLKARGKNPVQDFPSRMATYAALHAKAGRKVGNRASSKDVLSEKAQWKHGFRVESLPANSRRPFDDVYASPGGQRRIDQFEDRLQDARRWPVPEQAAFRIDFPAFMETLGRRHRRLLQFLADGNSGKDGAAKFNLSQGRVTQLRQQWRREWYAMHGEIDLV
jgi:hypothetical protein